MYMFTLNSEKKSYTCNLDIAKSNILYLFFSSVSPSL